MTNERIAGLRRVLSCVNERERWLSFEEFKDFLAILDDYEKVKAERDRYLDHSIIVLNRNKDLAAQLEKQRPLIEAVMGTDMGERKILNPLGLFFYHDDEKNILREALKLRSEK